MVWQCVRIVAILLHHRHVCMYTQLFSSKENKTTTILQLPLLNTFHRTCAIKVTLKTCIFFSITCTLHNQYGHYCVHTLYTVTQVLTIFPPFSYSCRILLSAVLPRAQSGFDTNRRSEDFLNKFNNIANEVNQTLSRATQSMDRIQFIEFPQYIVSGEIQRHLLSKDGLHLSFEGTEYVVSSIENQIFRSLWDITKIVC